MTNEEFAKVYESAKAIVSTWPEWKQNILELASKGTRDTPRPFVDNRRLNDKKSQS
jgi:hypothetical protein